MLLQQILYTIHCLPHDLRERGREGMARGREGERREREREEIKREKRGKEWEK